MSSGVDEEVRDLGADGRVADVAGDSDDIGPGRGALIDIDADDAAVRADRVSEDRRAIHRERIRGRRRGRRDAPV